MYSVLFFHSLWQQRTMNCTISFIQPRKKRGKKYIRKNSMNFFLNIIDKLQHNSLSRQHYALSFKVARKIHVQHVALSACTQPYIFLHSHYYSDFFLCLLLLSILSQYYSLAAAALDTSKHFNSTKLNLIGNCLTRQIMRVLRNINDSASDDDVF